MRGSLSEQYRSAGFAHVAGLCTVLARGYWLAILAALLVNLVAMGWMARARAS